MVQTKRVDRYRKTGAILWLLLFLISLSLVFAQETDSSLVLRPSATTAALISASTSSGGMLLIDNTLNPGAGFVAYTNAAHDAKGRLVNIRCDNTAFSQDCLHIDYDGSVSGLGIITDQGTGVSIISRSVTPGKAGLSITLLGDGGMPTSALTATSKNTEYSAVQISGVEKDTGTVKISHTGTGADEKAAALSIDLKGEATASQGIFVDATQGGTTGNLLSINNDGNRLATLSPNGFLGLGTASPLFVLDINDAFIRVRNTFTPDSSSAPCEKGQIAWDEDYVYVCISQDEWKRTALENW